MDMWIEDLFIRKAELFLKVVKSKWEKGEQEASQIAELMERHNIEAENLLELGCGNGRVAIPLAKIGYKVTCVDVSPLLIEDGRRRAAEAGVLGRMHFSVGDAREVSKLLKESYDFIYMTWTTLLGYYDEESDLIMLREARELVPDGGMLAILNTISRDAIARRQAECGSSIILKDLGGGMVLADHPRFDPASSRLTTKWVFYKKDGRDLIYVDEAILDFRVYDLRELVGLGKRSGWRFVAAYNDLNSFRDYIPGKSPLNVLFSPSASI